MVKMFANNTVYNGIRDPFIGTYLTVFINGPISNLRSCTQIPPPPPLSYLVSLFIHFRCRTVFHYLRNSFLLRTSFTNPCRSFLPLIEWRSSRSTPNLRSLLFTGPSETRRTLLTTFTPISFITLKNECALTSPKERSSFSFRLRRIIKNGYHYTSGPFP